jgi:hypothetical protein
MAVNLKIKISVTEVSVLLIHSSDSSQEFIPYIPQNTFKGFLTFG